MPSPLDLKVQQQFKKRPSALITRSMLNPFLYLRNIMADGHKTSSSNNNKIPEKLYGDIRLTHLLSDRNGNCSDLFANLKLLWTEELVFLYHLT